MDRSREQRLRGAAGVKALHADPDFATGHAEQGVPPRRSRVILYEACEANEATIHSVLDPERYEVVSCPGGQALLEEVVQRKPDVVVYGLRPDCEQDLGVLHLLRRMAPEVPLVLVASEASLGTQKQVQELRPIYYAVRPVDASELREALEAAVVRRGRTREWSG